MQGDMPREIKDIIRNVQQMDLPENGIADIRIKIQGGDVMDRPMFAVGGGANKFPDLSGDGKVTQKDILIGRGVIEKQDGGGVQGPFGEGGYDITTSLIRDPETNKLISEKEYNTKYPPTAPPEKTIFEKIKEAAKNLTNFRSEPYLFGNEELEDRYFDLLFDEYSKAVEKGPEETFRFISETEMPRAFRTGFLQLYKRDFGPDFGQKPKDMAKGGAVNPEQAIAQVEMAAEAEGEQLGLDYLASQMGGIDVAEDAEGLINALRGNEMPILARRTELAEYVGEEDAMRTPESVLAMVQPTIMMTEEGAMNSGIGELMQQLTSDVEMATEGGAPTDMGQGVGALMMAGAPEQPVQQFAAGGAVQYFQDGTQKDPLTGEDLFITGALRRAGALQNMQNTGSSPANLQTYFDEYLPLYENLIRDSESEEDRRKDRALALAKAGFRFASGVGPKGQNIAGQPLLSQAAAAAIPAIDELGDIESRRRKEDSALRTLAAQSAIKSQDAATTRLQKQQELNFAAALSLQKIGLEQMLKGDEFSIVKVKTGENEETPVLLNKKTGETSPLDDLDLTPGEAQTMLPDTLSTPKQISLLFQNLDGLAKGSVATEFRDQLDGLTDTLYPAETVIDGVKSVPTVPIVVIRSLSERLKRNETPKVQERLLEKARNFLEDPLKVARQNTNNAINNVTEIPEEQLIVDPSVDPTRQFGIGTALVTPFMTAITALEEEIGISVGNARFQAARNFFKDKGMLPKLISRTNRVLLRGMGGTRIKGELDQILSLTEKLRGSAFTLESTARVAAEGILVELRNLAIDSEEVIRSNREAPGSRTVEDVQAAQNLLTEVPRLIREYELLLEGFTSAAGRDDPRAMPKPRKVPLVNVEGIQETFE